MSEFFENENYFEDHNVILPNNSDIDNIRKLSPNTTSPIFKLNKIENLNDLVYSSDKNDITEESSNNLQLNDEVSSDVSHEEIVKSNCETTPERISREERESEQLAWELMQQENQELYNLQLQFMQDNAEHLNQDDLLLMQSLVNEATIRPNQSQNNNEGTNDDTNENEDQEQEDETESNPDEWDYERLLALGQQIGDVKTERWRLRAKSVIENLPKVLYKDISKTTTTRLTTLNEILLSDTSLDIKIIPHNTTTTNIEQTPSTSNLYDQEETKEEEASSSNKKRCLRNLTSQDENDTTVVDDQKNTNNTNNCNSIIINSSSEDVDRCVVCMDNFEENDEVLMLPCQHFFHIVCTEGWLAVCY